MKRVIMIEISPPIGMLRMVWKDSKGKFESGSYAVVGDVRCFDTFYDGISSRSVQPNRYKLHCSLPGVDSSKFQNFATEDEAMKFSAGVLSEWFKKFVACL